MDEFEYYSIVLYKMSDLWDQYLTQSKWVLPDFDPKLLSLSYTYRIVMFHYTISLLLPCLNPHYIISLILFFFSQNPESSVY